jgi:hypothetical protein
MELLHSQLTFKSLESRESEVWAKTIKPSKGLSEGEYIISKAFA